MVNLVTIFFVSILKIAFRHELMNNACFRMKTILFCSTRSEFENFFL
jgi:hypothetical protein